MFHKMKIYKIKKLLKNKKKYLMMIITYFNKSLIKKKFLKMNNQNHILIYHLKIINNLKIHLTILNKISIYLENNHSKMMMNK
jgi:hypothetical protein